MNRDFLLIDEDWGALTLSVCFSKIDVFPRLTVSDMTGALIVSVGLFMLTINLCVLNSVQREMNRKYRRHKNGDVG